MNRLTEKDKYQVGNHYQPIGQSGASEGIGRLSKCYDKLGQLEDIEEVFDKGVCIAWNGNELIMSVAFDKEEDYKKVKEYIIKEIFGYKGESV